jgi:hypothetical protein
MSESDEGGGPWEEFAAAEMKRQASQRKLSTRLAAAMRGQIGTLAELTGIRSAYYTPREQILLREAAAEGLEPFLDFGQQLKHLAKDVAALRQGEASAETSTRTARRLERRDEKIRTLQVLVRELANEIESLQEDSTRTQQLLEDALLEKSLELEKVRTRCEQAEATLARLGFSPGAPPAAAPRHQLPITPERPSTAPATSTAPAPSTSPASTFTCRRGLSLEGSHEGSWRTSGLGTSRAEQGAGLLRGVGRSFSALDTAQYEPAYDKAWRRQQAQQGQAQRGEGFAASLDMSPERCTSSALLERIALLARTQPTLALPEAEASPGSPNSPGYMYTSG